MSSFLKANLSPSFNPAEWYSLAQWLYDTKPALASQSLRRTIIGRAYYAALISARNSTHSDTAGQGGHERVVAELRVKDFAAANKLNSLRLKRQSADYRPDEVITDKDVTGSLKDSYAVLAALGVLPDNVAPHNKPYSHNYLDKNKFLP